MRISKNKKQWLNKSLMTITAYVKVSLLFLSVKYTKCTTTLDTTNSSLAIIPTLENSTLFLLTGDQIESILSSLLENSTETLVESTTTSVMNVTPSTELFSDPVTESTSAIETSTFSLLTPTSLGSSITSVSTSDLPPSTFISTSSTTFVPSTVETIITMDCPSLDDADQLSQTQLIERLTHPCRYDHLEHPKALDPDGNETPLKVYARNYIYFIQNLDAHDLQFKIHILHQLRYHDPRLAFKKISPNRKEAIIGEASFANKIWRPHLFLANEKSSYVMGTAEKDILATISPDGTVILSKRIQATLICWMNLRKFPFDEQLCSTVYESWMYNTSSMVLLWEPSNPVTKSQKLHLTEYVLVDIYINETVVEAYDDNLRHGYLVGNYSQLSFTLHLAREIGYYIMDYYLPSVMIVAISWVTFWLQADQTAPRAVLGTSTMLTFITLATSQGKTLPKVSYIKASEIWFLGCVGFIFASLMEFAFVNIIWRRKKEVKLKRVNTATVLKSTLTPRLARRELNNETRLAKSQTWAHFPDAEKLKNSKSTNDLESYLNTGNSRRLSIPSVTVEDVESNHGEMDDNFSTTSHKTWTTMKPQEVSCWIDKRSRLAFPMAFLLFNIFYWIFVYST